MLSLPEHKGKHFSLEFGLQRLIGGLRITMGKRSDRLSVGLCRGWNLYRLNCFFFFFANFSFSSRAIMEFPSWKGCEASEDIFWGRRGGCKRWKVDVVITSRFLSSLLKLSRALSHSCRFLQRWAESLSLLDSSFRIMQWWEMGKLHARGVCTHACVNVRVSDRRCLLWLKHISFWMQNTSAKTRIVIFITCWNTRRQSIVGTLWWFHEVQHKKDVSKKYSHRNDGTEII